MSQQLPGCTTGRRVRRGHVAAGLVSLAVLVRLVHIVIVVPEPLFDYHLTFRDSDMYFFDRWAERIVGGDVLGREVYHPLAQWQLAIAPLEKWEQWYGNTPVFYKAPLYAYLIALLRWLFGEPMLPLALLQVGASALSALLLLKIGERLFDPVAGLAAAAVYALYAPAIHYDAIMLRGPWIVLVSLAVTWQLVELRARPTVGRASVLGLTLGVALLVNEGFLTLLPLVAVVLAWWLRDRRRLAAIAGALVLGVAGTLAPLVARNVAVGAPPLALAVTGSTVYAVFNAADSDPYFFRIDTPSLGSLLEQGGGNLLATLWACLRTFSHVGELFLFYVRKAAGLVVPFENPDNASFYYAALKDPLLTLLPTYALLFPLGVVGLVLAARRPGRLVALLPAALSLLFSIMLTLPLSRYRVTLAAYLMPFAGVAVSHAAHWMRARRFLFLGAALLAALVLFAGAHALERQVVFAGSPPEAYWYRPTEFRRSAEHYMMAGRFKKATDEYLQLVRLNPDRAVRGLALLMAALVQVRQGDAAAARETLEAAVQANGREPRLLMDVGDVYQNLLQDRAQSALHYRRALALHPPDPLRRALRARLASVEGPPPVE